MSLFAGREELALAWCLRELALLKQVPPEAVHAELNRALLPTLTMEELIARNYTYCTYYDDKIDEKFLVPIVNKKAARAMAAEYLKAHGVTVFKPTKLHLYARNYITQAKQLFEEGKFYQQ
jgi:hypothetical protein